MTGCEIVGLDGDRYLRGWPRVNTFLGGGGAFYFAKLRLDQRSPITWSVNFNAHAGLESDLVKRRLFLRLEGTCKQNVPKNFVRKDANGKVIDRLDVKEQVSAPLCGATLGVIF